jgi:DNA-binding SARP family transcriptional activator/Tfp pilus assembly protein PilF
MLPVAPGKQRAVLASLLLNAGRIVAVDEIAETLWGTGPPPSARVTVQNYVMRLRQALGDTSRSLISTHPSGYLISVDAADLDITQFEVLLRAARAAASDGSWDAAAARAGAALALWRGEPLADAGSELLAAREAPRLAEMRLQALEGRIEADLHLGHHAEVIAELRRLISVHPLREHLHALLMLALYRCGRQAEALAAYQHARRILIEELGTEPGAWLQEMHQRVLTADPALSVAPPGQPAARAGSGPQVPRQLPAAVGYFAGRADELHALSGLIDGDGDAGRTLVISAIGGTAGVGKTALAVHWAHQVADRFPDGQLYVNLRGYDPARPMPAADALAGFLRALGVPGQAIPAEEDERAAQYRSLLASRRMLVVLDNARSVEQVRPLLPGAPACMVVVTSRDALTGLVARDGARRLELDPLPVAEAIDLLRALIGARVDVEPDAAAALAAQCSRLPLALRVAAELAAARPAIPLANLAGELADQQRRLDLLDAGGDLRTGIRGVLSWSYRHLDADAARTFRLAGLHPGPDLDRHAIAALAGTTAEQAGYALDQLVRAHLIQRAGPDRYGLHDLLRSYARELAARDGEDEQQAALTRLFDHYLHLAAAAMDALFPTECHRRPRISRPAILVPVLSDPAAAQAWLDAERANLTAVAARTANGWPGHTTRLAAILFRYLDVGSHFHEAAAVHGHARSAALQTGDHAAEAEALTSLSVLDTHQGRYQQAAGHLQRSLALQRETGDRTGQARALCNLGLIDLRQGRHQQAAGHLQQSLALFRETGDSSGEAHALTNLGFVDFQQGRYQQAASHQERLLALQRETGDRTGQARALCNLGLIDLRQGRHQQATSHLLQSLALFRETGNRDGEADVLANLGDVDFRQSRYQQAASHYGRALALAREAGNQAGEAEVLNGLGEVLLVTGQPGQARTRHATALGLASQIGDQDQQARAHNGLGRCYRAAGDAGQAQRHWQEALALYSSLGAPEAEQVRAELRKLPTPELLSSPKAEGR